ncbi:MAG: hypothetical protein RIR33_2616 [Pseudomonadota bacterium]
MEPEPLARRSACVLSVDVVGFSRMMARDDMASVVAIGACRRIVERHVLQSRGRVFGSAGDSFMAELPDPLAAVRCGIAIQKDLQSRNGSVEAPYQLTLRAGIDAGSVIDENGNLFGDVVNVAARLQEVCLPGGILVSRAIHDAVKNMIDLRPRGELSLKNIAVPVGMFEVMDGDQPFGSAVGEFGAINLSRVVPGMEGAPILAILPLDNRTGDSDQEPVCVGFSEDLITLVSRIRQFTVIDRNSTFSLRSGQPNIRATGRRLGARYLLEGRLQRSSEGYEVSMWLTDLETDRQVWGERYVPDWGDVLPSRTDIALRVSATLGGRIEQAEADRFRGRRESRVGVRGLLWRSRWHLDQLNRRDADEAFRLLTEAEQSDPSNPEVMIQLAHAAWIDAWSMRKPPDALARVLDKAIAARDADPEDGRGHLLVGVSQILLGRLDEALEHLSAAIRLNPSLAMAYAQRGSCFNLKGRFTEAIPELELALRLSPGDYYAFYVFGELAISHLMLGDWARTISLARKALAIRPAYWNARVSEIAALVNSGEMEQARHAYRALIDRTPNFERKFIDWLPYEANAVRAFLADAVEKARTYEIA